MGTPFVLGAFFYFGEGRAEGETTMWSPRVVRRWLGRHASTVISLWSVVSWQAESLQSSESTSGEMAVLQRAIERPVLQRPRDTCCRELRILKRL